MSFETACALRNWQFGRSFAPGADARDPRKPTVGNHIPGRSFMTGVAELLDRIGASAPIQRVRNYHLTDREASPRPRDFTTAMKQSDGEVCVRWAGPPGDCVVRYDDPDWKCAEHNRFRGRTEVETLTTKHVQRWLQRSPPELVAHETVQNAFEERCAAPLRAETGTALADGGQDAETTNHVRVESCADVFGDSDLDRLEAQSLAAALPSAPGEIVFRLPLVLAEESVLESVAGTDRVFVAELVPERETQCALYVRQNQKGCWVPKDEATTYELADGVLLDVDLPESPESA